MRWCEFGERVRRVRPVSAWIAAFLVSCAQADAAWLYRLGADGLPVGEAVNAFAGRANITRPGHFVPFDGGLYVPVEAAAEGTGSQEVRLYTVDASGTVLAEELIASPALGPNAVLVGSDVVVTFVTTDGFGLARHRP